MTSTDSLPCCLSGLFHGPKSGAAAGRLSSDNLKMGETCIERKQIDGPTAPEAAR